MMFYVQAYNEKGYAFLGTDSSVLVELKTLRGLKNRMKNWVKWRKDAAYIKVFVTSRDGFYRFDREKAAPIAVFPVVNGATQF